MSARVAFLSTPLSPDQRTAKRVVPTRAIQAAGSERWVYRVSADKVRRVVIHPGEPLGEYTVIDPVLPTGESVVLDPSPTLTEGASVRLLKHRYPRNFTEAGLRRFDDKQILPLSQRSRPRESE